MKSLQGHLLVASPKLHDPNFFKAVVLMVQHYEEGALGLILNRPTDTTISDAWSHVSDTSCQLEQKVHHGGPCEGPLMVVHKYEPASDHEVASGIYFTAQPENVEWLFEQNGNPIKFFVGCAGWAPEQLEQELATGSWLTAPANNEHVFLSDENQWSNVTREIANSTAFPGLNPKIIPKDPSMN